MAYRSMALSATLLRTNCSSETGNYRLSGHFSKRPKPSDEGTNRTNPPVSIRIFYQHPDILTDDLLAMLDQHFLNDRSEMFDGFNCLQNRETRCMKTNLQISRIVQTKVSQYEAVTRDKRWETNQFSALCQLWVYASLQRQTGAQTCLPARTTEEDRKYKQHVVCVRALCVNSTRCGNGARLDSSDEANPKSS